VKGAAPPPDGMWLETLDLGTLHQDWGQPQVGKSIDKNPLRLKGVTYPHGIGSHAQMDWSVNLKGAARRFVAMVGLDDEREGQGSIVFEVWVDGKKAAETPVMKGGDAPKLLSVDLTGAQRLELSVTDGGDGITNDHADWAGALLILDPAVNAKVNAEKIEDPAPPIAPSEHARPVIHAPRRVGATPGRPFLFRIPASGEGPLTFSARNLPAGLTLDSSTGILSGALRAAGTSVVELTASGPRGRAQSRLTIVGGEHQLAQTPPMGWNSWNVWGTDVTAERVRKAADALISTGLAAHGFQYVNIDDAWEADRGPDGEIRTNAKFGDMKALAESVHARGLKLGIYSSPGPKTCGGYEGSYEHEEQDARTYARWGIDYLKYDWCSYGSIAKDQSLPELQKPYRVMRAALDRVDRDIVYSLCQYGMGDVSRWGAQVGGNLWRTTGDITDTWGSLSSIAFSQQGLEPFAGPGHWNDPDMLVVGKVGWGPNLHPTRLTRNEQITHLTMWSILAAPLLIGCDLTQMDPFTMALLTNDEVLEVNQDGRGKQGSRRSREGSTEVWARELEDGTVAVALINRGRTAAPVRAEWKALGLEGKQPVRNLWLHQDLGTAEGSFTAEVPRHGAMLLKVGKPARR
jgi:alpha-galactosidase